MRLFIAVELDLPVKNAINNYCEELKKLIPSGRYVKIGNLHITLKFLGETPPAKLSQIKQTLDTSFGGVRPFTISSAKLLTFRSGDTHILSLGIKSSAELQQLAKICDENMEKLGFAAESRAFKPHITLAREAVLACPLPQLAANLSPLDLNIEVNSVTLFESRREKDGLIYIPLHRTKL